MVVTFKSRAAADVIMLGDHAHALLRILGKDADARQGILTAEQLPDAIAALQAAIEADRERDRQRQNEPEDENEDEPPPTGIGAAVSLHQRGWPLLEMLRQSLDADKPVTWES
ncbi:DUF1840 domain-containing protein [Pseudazoarcus pumilus]|uniref:DUF1840 domain-containing protein n=1 Tax=Pseudazoarcus pumilus TaxID=2067960 RepID=A0A2I6S9M8_9RHOO|nr:DUF1840 domain-containing protein [Pseudazoarcus pumilus]AUN95937.1 DUF1840 domain-containing protein [Pseudazoarcus pumilus]